jgi:hypothetical protein
MTIDLLMLLLFAPVVIGLLYTGYRIHREELNRERLEAAAGAAPREAVGVPEAAAEPERAPSWAVVEIERRLRHEHTLARAFAQDPCEETLWLG